MTDAPISEYARKCNVLQGLMLQVGIYSKAMAREIAHCAKYCACFGATPVKAAYIQQLVQPAPLCAMCTGSVLHALNKVQAVATACAEHNCARNAI